MSKLPLSVTLDDAAILPLPDRARVPSLPMVVAPVNVLVPLSVSVPPLTVTPPEPAMTPPKVSLALVSVRVLPPRATLPLPASDWIDAPLVVAEMSKVPLSVTLDDAAILPLPDRARVPSLPTLVAPV